MTLSSTSKVSHGVRTLTADQIPLRIVADLFNQLAKEADASALTVGALGFALRKRGRGNHSWVLFLHDGTSPRMEGEPGRKREARADRRRGWTQGPEQVDQLNGPIRTLAMPASYLASTRSRLHSVQP